MHDIQVYFTFLILILILGGEGSKSRSLDRWVGLPPYYAFPVNRLEILGDGRLAPVDTVNPKLKFSSLTQDQPSPPNNRFEDFIQRLDIAFIDRQGAAS